MTEFSEIRSITPPILAKLQEEGVLTVECINFVTKDEMKDMFKGISVGEEKIDKIKDEVWRKTGATYVPANKLRKDELTLTTGSEAIDSMLKNQIETEGGGVRSRTITEFAGKGATGKTEFLYNVITINLDKHKDWSAVFYDTEATFSDLRLREVCNNRNLDAEDIMKRVFVVQIWNTEHFEAMVKQADIIIKTNNVKIICVDSLIGSIRAEATGRGELAERQQRLNKLLRRLLNLARAFNSVVIVTNQVSDKPDQMFTMDPVELHPPVGGNIIGHNDNERVYLRKASGTGNVRVARLIDSCRFPPSERPYVITAKGIEDTKDWKEASAKLEQKARMTPTTNSPTVTVQPVVEGEEAGQAELVPPPAEATSEVSASG